VDHDVNTGGVDCLDEVDPGVGLATRLSRRRGLGLLAGASALISGLASACGFIQLVEECTLGGPSCCHLATCRECAWEGTKDQYTCRDGWHQTYWTCIDENGASWVCGECAWETSTNCFEGPFNCSIWY
jgi:hypothetical protein